MIDHINGDKEDNRLINLRECDHRTNGRNCKRSVKNTSGITGVRMDKRIQKWVAEIKIDGTGRHLGSFDTIEEAAAARKGAEKVSGFHANHGRTENEQSAKL